MDFLAKLRDAIFQNVRTSVIGLVSGVFAVFSEFGIVVSPNRTAAIIAALLALLGFSASDGGKPEEKA